MCGIWAVFGYDQAVSSELHQALEIQHRGPDFTRIESIPHYEHSFLGFHRLSIMDDLRGQQPMTLFVYPHVHLIYNGEIYNYKELTEKYQFKTDTGLDGEVIIHLYVKFGIEKTLQLLDGVFGLVIFDSKDGVCHIGRDTFGVRPVFTHHPASGHLGVCSEAKGLIQLAGRDEICKILPFTPGSYASYKICKATGLAQKMIEKKFTDVDVPPVFDTKPTLGEDVKENIRNIFTEAVNKRLMAERRIGCLLSGGLDSSLVAGLVVRLAREQNLPYKIQTFSIGMKNSPDLIAAKKVADLLQTEHHEVRFTPEEAFAAIPAVNYSLESYDITTNRASIPMYLLAQYIRKNTDTVVIFSGEGSDELTQGYIYFHKAPSKEEAHEESKRLLRHLYYYDNLRADRTVCAHGLELRVPFLDKQFTSYYLSLPKDIVQPQQGVEKYLLRSAFDGQPDLLPREVLWRAKEAFSDGVSTKEDTWSVMLEKHAQTKVTEAELQASKEAHPCNTPVTYEALYYRQLFESKFKGHEHLIPYFWMPKWIHATDPSARVLEHYKQ